LSGRVPGDPDFDLEEETMFGRNGVTYLAREREIIAGSAGSRKTHRQFLASLLTAGVLVLLLAGAIAIRLMPHGPSF
jgi:hypothetical protein